MRFEWLFHFLFISLKKVVFVGFVVFLVLIFLFHWHFTAHSAPSSDLQSSIFPNIGLKVTTLT